MSTPLKIIQLKAENIKRIKAIEINPSDNTVIISGENGQGKSSVLDSIWLALNVSEANKEISAPIRNGEDKAKSVIDLGDIKVTRTWTSKGTYLKVEPKEIVSKYGGAQSVLDAFIGKLSFDPMEFIKLPDKEQRDMLLKLVDIGIDLDAWEVKRKQVYDERTDVNRQLKEYQIKVDSVPAITDDTPDKEMNIQLILIEYENARQTEDRKLQAKNRILEIDNEIIELSNERIKLKDSIRIMPTYDLPEIQNRLNNSEQINKNVRSLKQYTSDTLAFETYQKNVETLNSRLEQMDKQKNDAIESANFPISGLGFSDSGVTYNNIPISQIATSEQIKVSMSIAMALNPNLRVIIIKEGSLLDHKNLELVKQMVKDKDYQLWIECVDDSGKLGIVIEDGQVKEQPVCQDPRLFVKDGELHKKNETELEKHGNTEHVDIQSGPVPDNMGESKKDGGWF
jgi:hypothetical protein